MDIRDWSLDQIMQLPDHCFGRRWPIGMSVVLANANPVFDIAEIRLPDRCVIWSINIIPGGGIGVSAECAVSLGSVLPATDAEFMLLESVFPGFIDPNGVRGSVVALPVSSWQISTLRLPVVSAGLSFVARFIRNVGVSPQCSCIIVVSSIPNEVPDCLL